MNGKMMREKAILLLCIGLIAAPHASAEAVLADLIVNIPEPRNDAELNVAISLNGTAMPTQNQTLSLMVGDTVLIEFTGTATGNSPN